jgi:hypothetical protein
MEAAHTATAPTHSTHSSRRLLQIRDRPLGQTQLTRGPSRTFKTFSSIVALGELIWPLLSR